MGLGKKIVDVMQQVKAIQKVKEEEAKSTPAVKATADDKLPMSKRRTRSLQKQSQLNNQTTLLGG
jgi:hypothetical protein